MECPNCGKEYFDNNQIICEYCGTEIVSNSTKTQIPNKSKLEQFIEDSGIKDIYKKVKESLKQLKD
jgi:uncharacterized OB-fold protein